MPRLKSFILFCLVAGIIIARMAGLDKEAPAQEKSSGEQVSAIYSNYA